MITCRQAGNHSGSRIGSKEEQGRILLLGGLFWTTYQLSGREVCSRGWILYYNVSFFAMIWGESLS